jgi:hypothetical protein
VANLAAMPMIAFPGWQKPRSVRQNSQWPNDPWREPSVSARETPADLRYRTCPGPRGLRYIAASGGTGMSVLMRILLVGTGSLITLAGVIFALQGVGVIGGSFMSGTTTWAVAGPVIALAGLALVVLGLRAYRRP